MATPKTASQFIDALKAEGCKVKEHIGWRTHNRAGHGDWGPLYGVMIHHTAGLNVEQYVYEGTTALPGPLCHVYIDKAGTVHMIGWGRTNHAGGGDPAVLAAVKAKRATLPKTHEHQGSDGAVDGNAHFIGAECENKGDGNDPWPAVQLDAMRRFSAAVARQYGWNAKQVIRHLDWSDYKSDPKGVDWPKFQKGVQALLDGDAPSHPPTTPPPAGLPKVSLAHLIEAARKDPPGAQGHTTHKTEVELFERGLVKLGYLDKKYADGSFGTKTKDATRALQRHLGYSGNAADGIPGKNSATWLGLKTQLYVITD